jgi:hypothetical protein
MNEKKGIVSIESKHIDPGIKKYNGEIDIHLSELIKSAGLAYTPYLFSDGRILLVLPYATAAFLYPDKETLFEALSLI